MNENKSRPESSSSTRRVQWLIKAFSEGKVKCGCWDIRTTIKNVFLIQDLKGSNTIIRNKVVWSVSAQIYMTYNKQKQVTLTCLKKILRFDFLILISYAYGYVSWWPYAYIRKDSCGVFFKEIPTELHRSKRLCLGFALNYFS